MSYSDMICFECECYFRKLD